ncbi:hypothetical protein EST38_g2671 [Candolleomyces aberdarensis]|uniref:N-acetyltransferase domain-containing protein n=1 Tax=Candolleomyces aberdarensis TaxID=2316362 RepID=A0A4Q2DV14_9AGAR|nr:hypothetical protein EST38_g2671 [Candolleomyces aberdarensis]
MADPSKPSPATSLDPKSKSLVDRKSEDFELFKLRDKIDVDKCAIRIRTFQPEDAEQVQELFWVGITVGPLSSLGAALRGSPKRPNSIFLYVLFVFGLYLAIFSPSLPQYAAVLNLPFDPISETIARNIFCQRLLGVFLSIVSIALFVAHRYHLGKAFRGLANPEQNPDLMNLGKHYGAWTVLDEKNGMKGEEIDSEANYKHHSGGKIKSASGFWVAELLAPEDRKPTGYIVGCVGLDNTVIPNDPAVAQLRRMAVHPLLQRRGIGRRLISHVLSHASLLHPDGFRIKAVELVTTGFQPSAVGIYESFGWKRVRTEFGAPGRWWLDWYAVHYRLELGDKYYDRVA